MRRIRKWLSPNRMDGAILIAAILMLAGFLWRTVMFYSPQGYVDAEELMVTVLVIVAIVIAAIAACLAWAKWSRLRALFLLVVCVASIFIPIAALGILFLLTIVSVKPNTDSIRMWPSVWSIVPMATIVLTLASPWWVDYSILLDPSRNGRLVDRGSIAVDSASLLRSIANR